MSEMKKRGFCKDCGRNVIVFRKGTNHILHLLICAISLVFFFPLAILWAFVWFCASVKIGGWKCSQCGSKRTGYMNKLA